jgi:hypothetical protein
MNIISKFKHVFTPSYIFDFTSMIPVQSDRLYLIVGLAMTVVGAVFKIISAFSTNPVSRRLWQRLASPFITIGILEALWFLARQQNIKLFGSHFVAWLMGIVFLVWLYFPIRYLIGSYRYEKQQWEKQQIKLKYIKH